jgi:hypothetical protein
LAVCSNEGQSRIQPESRRWNSRKISPFENQIVHHPIDVHLDFGNHNAEDGLFRVKNDTGSVTLIAKSKLKLLQ